MVPAPSLLDRIRSRLTGTPAAAYATRRLAAADLVKLRTHLSEQTRRLEEGLNYFDQLAFPNGRWPKLDLPNGMQPGEFGGVYGMGWASGTVNDRRGGKDAPLFWSEVDLRQFRVTSRLLCETNEYAIGFLGLLVDFHVRGGYGWQACLKGAKKGAYDTGTQADVDPAVRACQTALDEWRDGTPTDPTTSWPVVSREAFRRFRRDGEVFVRLFRGGRGRHPVLRFVEPEQVGSPGGNTDGPDSFGVLTDPDDVKRVLAYFVRDPNGDGTSGEWVTASWAVDVRDVERLTGGRWPVVPGCVIHLKANVDSSVKRGVPDFAPVGEGLEAVRGLNSNMAVVARLQAAISHVEQFATATAFDVARTVEQGKTYDRPAVLAALAGQAPGTVAVKHYEPGSVIRTESGRQYLDGPLNRGAAGFIQVAQACLRGAGTRWRFPEYFSGDASNGSYASLKESGSPFVACVEGGQLEWGAFERAVAVCVLYLAGESGRLDRADVATCDVETQAPKVVMTDKGQEDQRRKTQYDAGALSLTEWIQADGRDPKHTFANLKAEREQGFGKPQQPQTGGGGTSPNADPFAAESRVAEHGQPPRPGLVWNDRSKRWVRPDETPAPAKKPAAKANTPGGSTPPAADKPAGVKAPPAEHAKAVALAKKKLKAAPVPTADEVAYANKKVDELGANAYRRNLVGNTHDRRKRRESLLSEFGDGEKCPCVYCGVYIGEGTLEQDKIYTTREGGKYRLPNLIPSCSGCNKVRSDKPLAAVLAKVKTDAPA
jgi:capsid protein